ncbi:SMI1/KNR4 family protein [Mesorhizobium sp. M0488]|uniref:SMI1/KNR4 family protein n=1 Tax=unclassified Mesorhizobium TaxID=325217 RepID=UPI003338F6E1
MLTLPELIEQFQQRSKEYDLLALDEDLSDPPNPPATEQDIRRFEKEIGYVLPEDYRAFLLLHDGWPGFEGDAPLLGIGNRNNPETVKILRGRSGLFDQFSDENPIKSGALPILIAPGVDDMLFYFPKGPDAGKFVSYDNVDREDVFDTFADFLRDRIDTLDYLIRQEKEGVDPGEED